MEELDGQAALTVPSRAWGSPQQTRRFALEQISRYDDAGPAWYWNNFSTGEHTGTHLDAPIHWVTGKDGADVSQIAPRRLVAPAAVSGLAAEASARPGLLLEVEHGHPLDVVRQPDRDLAAIARGYDAKVASARPSWWLEEAFRGH